jgi:hypothetical protein
MIITVLYRRVGAGRTRHEEDRHNLDASYGWSIRNTERGETETVVN